MCGKTTRKLLGRGGGGWRRRGERVPLVENLGLSFGKFW